MSRDWKPGDVALVTSECCGERVSLRRVTGSWVDVDSVHADDEATARPLLVIDPEDREQVHRLADAFCRARWDHTPGSSECDPLTAASMREALRSLLAPPRPDEPTGLGAVVRDGHGCLWVRAEDSPNPWCPQNPAESFIEWENIAAPIEVLSEGVLP
jgi:hypothetical protein